MWEITRLSVVQPEGCW